MKSLLQVLGLAQGDIDANPGSSLADLGASNAPLPAPPAKTCGTCTHLAKVDDGVQCRGGPPGVTVVNNQFRTLYPYVTVNFPACARHEPIEAT